MIEEYSVLMSVYKKEKPEYFKKAIDSMLKQTVFPGDFVIVCDGELVPELDEVIDSYLSLYPDLFNIVRLPENKGLGNALRIGLEACKYEFVARMDTDDISVPDRMEKQLAVFDSHPEFSVVGGQIAEFSDNEQTILDYRIVPTSHKAIYAMAKSRNPMNHMTVVMKKSDVIESGNYCDFPYFEDYHMWVRMLSKGKLLCNVDDVCVMARVNSMFSRRTGVNYFKRAKNMMKFLLSIKMISYPRYIINVFVRFVATVVVPKKMLNHIMPVFTRKKLLKAKQKIVQEL